MRGYLKGACVVLAVLLVFSLFRLGAEEAEQPREAEKKGKKVYAGTLFGSFWAPYRDYGGESIFMTVDMRAAFENERSTWSFFAGLDRPFSGSLHLEKDAVRSCYLSWLSVQVEILKKKGWRVAACSGDVFLFERSARFKYFPESSSGAELLKKAADQSDDFRWRGREGHGVFSFPFHRPADLSLRRKDFKTSLDSYASFSYLVVPPGAYALRMYFPVAVAKKLRIYSGVYLNKEAFAPYFSFDYDMNAENILTVKFNRYYIGCDRFWRWKLLHLKLANKYPDGKSPDWVAWEFLGPDGEPLPDCVSPPTRWFPKDFKKRFRPMPIQQG